ncbi:MAG: transglycosylase SLT domain-containing protein [Bacteroidota bacterium]
MRRKEVRPVPYRPFYGGSPWPRISGKLTNALLVVALVLGSNYLSHRFWNPQHVMAGISPLPVQQEELYLLDKAALFVPDTYSFSQKVQEIAGMLQVPPEWLMAVMYAESKFDASVYNYKGSGAVGLIQFMPATAASLNASAERLSRMGPVQQLEYVYLYMEQVRQRYGAYQSLTDFYLAILYPKARGQDYCYTLYATPSKAYRQNKGLDEDKDGRVTVSDIDRRMKRLFPKAFVLQAESIG